MERNEGVGLEEFFVNPGKCLIGRLISSFLDGRTLAHCRLVCYSWKRLIDNDRHWLVLQLKHINESEKTFIDIHHANKMKMKTTILQRFPEWNSITQTFARKRFIPDLQVFVQHMWIYFKCQTMSYYRNPLQNAIANSNMTFVKLVIDSEIDLAMKSSSGGWTLLHFASRYANIDMVSFLLHHAIGDPISRTNCGATVFHMAAQNPDFHVPMLMLDTFLKLHISVIKMDGK